ncbi:hypothetical protein BDZ89DRAFT_928379, partial [Hymenopellis radicata]
ITRIVNNLGIKMEIGNPLMCSYLLGFPDHYTNAKFVLFFWKHYYSKLDDYMFRPLTLSHLCVWDWVRRCKVLKERSTENEKVIIPEDENYIDNDEFSDGLIMESSDGYQSDSSTLYDKTIVDVEEFPFQMKQDKSDDDTIGKHYFADGHGLKNTHYVTYCSEEYSLIPNMTGGALPRRDQENRDYYCCTMLAIFKPWTVPSDLKDKEETWSQAFNAYNFTDRQKQLMNNFHLRYECLDARDNFRDQMKKNLDVDQRLQAMDD